MHIFKQYLLIFTLAISGWLSTSVYGQSEIKTTDILDSLAIQLLDTEIKNNTTIVDSILELLAIELQSESFKSEEFDKLKVLQYLWSPDSTISIFSGMIREHEGTGYYGGVFNHKSKVWYPLQYVSNNMEYFEKEQSGQHDWYGSVYYGIYPFESEGATKYVVFGFRENDYYTNSKLTDVIYFNEEGIQFGDPVFIDSTKNRTHNRFMLTYAAEAPIKLNFDQLEGMIVFDHLIPMKHLYERDRFVMVQDGSYSAYYLDNGKWYFISKLEVIPVDVAPREQPILDNRKNKDIFGRPTKNSDGNRAPSN